MGKALFFDIDGTIWDNQFQIPDSTISAIKELQKNSHQCFLCSGRTRNHIRDSKLLNLGFDGIIAGCGTYIEHHGTVIFHHEIEEKQLERTVRILQKHKIATLLEGQEYHYLNESDFQGDPYLNVLRESMGERLLSLDENWGKWSANKMTIGYRWEDWQEAQKELGDEYHYIIHNEELGELVPRGYDKGWGIQKTCELLQIPKEDTYAFGDSANDLEMIRDAGTGIAMGNATKELKQAADYVTTDIHQDGILHAVRHFQLVSELTSSL